MKAQALHQLRLVFSAQNCTAQVSQPGIGALLQVSVAPVWRCSPHQNITGFHCWLPLLQVSTLERSLRGLPSKDSASQAAVSPQASPEPAPFATGPKTDKAAAAEIGRLLAQRLQQHNIAEVHWLRHRWVT